MCGTHPYDSLTPDLILDAVESLGFYSDARILALNSYENRVYQVGVEDGTPIIAKFYRPGRWNQEQILEEHRFAQELLDQELSVVAPLSFAGKTLHQFQGFLFALYPRRGGHAPELDNPDHLLELGRLVGRIHACGNSKPFTTRQSLSLQRMAVSSREFLLASSHLPADLEPAYRTLTADLIKKLEQIEALCMPLKQLRIHGDCHPGNILWRDDQWHFVDFDDCINGPAIQDLWMFLSGDRQQQQLQLAELIEGYQEFFDFDPKELRLVEYLRTLRLIHYAAWLAKRWDDPAFPQAFPWFNSPRYWSDHILELREQMAALDEEPLRLY